MRFVMLWGLVGCAATATVTTSADQQATIDALEAQLRDARAQAAACSTTTTETADAQLDDSAPSHDDAPAADRPSMPSPLSNRGRFVLDAMFGQDAGGAPWRLAYGGNLRYFVTDSLEIGAAMRAYSTLSGASAGQWPAHETAWSADWDVLYSPFAATHVPLVHDLFIDSGIGVIATRPIPVVDPSRSFDYSDVIDVVAGIGWRMPLTPWLTADAEIRDLVYNTPVEDQQIAANARDPSMWLAPTGQLTNDFELDLGVSVLFPL